MKEFQDDYGVLADPRHFVLDEKEYQKIEGEGGEGGATVDPTPKEVTYTENGEYTVEPGEGFDGLSSVNVTVDVPTPSGGNVLLLKRNNTPIPYNPGHWNEEDDEYIDPTAIPFDLISSESASSINYYRCIMNEDMEEYDTIQGFTSSNLPLTINYTPFDDQASDTREQNGYRTVIILGTNTPGATLRVDTRYFDIVELPSGYSADFSVDEVTPEQ